MRILRRTPILVVSLIALIIVLYVFVLISIRGSSFAVKQCPVSGPSSSAPLNELDFKLQLSKAVNTIKFRKIDTIVCTSVNEEAAKHNLPEFLFGVSSVSPSLSDSLIVFCLDSVACSLCRRSHQPDQCVYMNLGLSSQSLAPGGSNKLNDDYWRLTFGRVFATLTLHSHNVNVLTVDVDSIFLQNPFIRGNGIFERPNDIAVVSDVAPFTFKYGSKVSINGGFLYFPGVHPTARRYSKEVLDLIWAKNCEPKKNEQLVTSSVLRHMNRKYAKDPNYNPHMLSNSQYLNFCSTTCGTGEVFNSVFDTILSLSDLQSMERSMTGKDAFKDCERDRRTQWVFFHAACLSKANPDQLIVARNKGLIQKAIYQWVQDSRE